MSITDDCTVPGLIPLTGVPQHYDWGGYDFIPHLLGQENTEHKPFAELWMGAHPNAPANAQVGYKTEPLNKLIESNPKCILGEDAAAKFEGRLPYLFKVLDARKMLSIQAHPTKQQAEEGYARENAEGVDLKDSKRNYKDDNHKPEVHVVLTDFWMLHGFRPLEEIAEQFTQTPELASLMPDFTQQLTAAGSDQTAREDLLRSLYERAMTLPQAEVDALLEPLLARLESAKSEDKDAPDFWARRAATEFPLPDGHRDRGIISIYLLNLLHLKPGQGTYQPAGTLHAYLEGVNMELMANSDNVMRGGLTPKHVDVPELLKILQFNSGHPPILMGEIDGGETVYPTPAKEFVLSRIELHTGETFTHVTEQGPETLIVLSGTVVAKSGNEIQTKTKGEVFLIPVDHECTLEAETDNVVLFRAAIPAG